MSSPHDLADPDFEPSDADLVGLSVRAFAGVRAEREEALAKLRAKVAEAREAVLRALAERSACPRNAP